MAIYERHQPESTVLYQSVARAWPKIEVEYAINEQVIAPHVTSEFQKYTRCGILEHGFVTLYCKDCQAERVIGFSCKGRGVCPSCGSRRALQKADRIEREVWPNARARQFVLTFPHQVRSWLLRSPELLHLKGHTEFSAVSKINWHNTKNVTGSSLYSENLVGP
jgi:hypothetical protein